MYLVFGEWYMFASFTRLNASKLINAINASGSILSLLRVHCTYFPSAKWFLFRYRTSSTRKKKKWHERFDANKVSLISCAFSVHVWQNNVLKRISSTIIEGVFVAIKHRQQQTLHQQLKHLGIDAYLGMLQLYLRLQFPHK